MTNERLTWKQIQDKYPDQWVGITDIEWEPDNDASVKTAIAKYTDKTKSELTGIQIDTDGRIQAVYTTPDHIFQLGAVGYFS